MIGRVIEITRIRNKMMKHPWKRHTKKPACVLLRHCVAIVTTQRSVRSVVNHLHVPEGVDMAPQAQLVHLRLACPPRLFPFEWTQQNKPQNLNTGN